MDRWRFCCSLSDRHLSRPGDSLRRRSLSIGLLALISARNPLCRARRWLAASGTRHRQQSYLSHLRARPPAERSLGKGGVIHAYGSHFSELCAFDSTPEGATQYNRDVLCVVIRGIENAREPFLNREQPRFQVLDRTLVAVYFIGERQQPVPNDCLVGC